MSSWRHHQVVITSRWRHSGIDCSFCIFIFSFWQTLRYFSFKVFIFLCPFTISFHNMYVSISKTSQRGKRNQEATKYNSSKVTAPEMTADCAHTFIDYHTADVFHFTDANGYGEMQYAKFHWFSALFFLRLVRCHNDILQKNSFSIILIPEWPPTGPPLIRPLRRRPLVTKSRTMSAPRRCPTSRCAWHSNWSHVPRDAATRSSTLPTWPWRAPGSPPPSRCSFSPPDPRPMKWPSRTRIRSGNWAINLAPHSDLNPTASRPSFRSVPWTDTPDRWRFLCRRSIVRGASRSGSVFPSLRCRRIVGSTRWMNLGGSNQSINRLIDRSIRLRAIRWLSQSINQSIRQSIDQASGTIHSYDTNPITEFFYPNCCLIFIFLYRTNYIFL